MGGYLEQVHAAFRLDLEQQRGHAEDLLAAATSRDRKAMTRIATHLPALETRLERGDLRLADAQLVVARELRFANWSALAAHVRSLDRAREAIRGREAAPDADMPTLHVRCGSDIRSALADAGFGGDFLEVSYPYCHGPVSAAPDRFEREARYLAEVAGRHIEVTYEDALASRHAEERRLLASATDYARVVLWKEHDCFDQLVLVRCLAHYASAARPPVLELIDVDHFPGRWTDGVPVRFKGLGQLPPEALRLLFARRGPVTAAQLALGARTWDALALDDPRPLAALLRSNTVALPHLRSALQRLLEELPAVRDGLSRTQRLVLEAVAAEESLSLQRLFELVTGPRDPLFFATDLKLLEIVEMMQSLAEPVLGSRPGEGSAGDPWQRVVTITPAGRAVVQGSQDFMSLRPPARWVGGVEVRSGGREFRWDDVAQRAVASPPPQGRIDGD